MYVICMSISHLFSSGMKLRVRKFRDLIEFSQQGSIRVSSILHYFISIRTWVENHHIKTVLKILWLQCQVIFTRTRSTKIEILYNRLSNIVNIQTTHYALLMF